MKKSKLLFDHVNRSGFAYFKPAGCLHRPGPSLFVNPTLVSRHFGGLEPERTSVALAETVSRSSDRTGPGMTAIKLLLDHVNKKGCAYYRPVEDEDDRGPSVLINRTLVSSYFRGSMPAKSLTLLVETVSGGVGV